MDLTRWFRTQWDRTIAVGLGLAAIVCLIGGWLGVKDTPFPAEQLPYILSGGIAGLVLAGFATTVWLSADLRDEWRKLDSLDEVLRALRRETLDVVASDGAPCPDRKGNVAVSEVGIDAGASR